MNKICPKCKLFLSLNNFYIDYRRNKPQCWCKKCFSLRNKLPNVKEWHKEYRKKNRIRYTELNRQYRTRNPWITHYYLAKWRCEKKNFDNYKYYGGRGIKFLMTKNNFKNLWFKDKAYLLKQPSIDRINVNGNYELSNCRFVEISFNSSRVKRKNENSFCGI